MEKEITIKSMSANEIQILIAYCRARSAMIGNHDGAALIEFVNYWSCLPCEEIPYVLR